MAFFRAPVRWEGRMSSVERVEMNVNIVRSADREELAGFSRNRTELSLSRFVIILDAVFVL